MTKLKPQLIITGSNKKKGGFVSGIGHFLVLVVVFVLGVYVGMRIDSTDLDVGQTSNISEENITQSQNFSEAPENIVVESSLRKSITNIKDTPPSVIGENTVDGTDVQTENIAISSQAKNIEELATTNLYQQPTQIENELPIEQGGIAEPVLEPEDSYRLQVAAFGNLEDANDFVNGQKLKGYDAYIVTTSNSRGEVWNLIKVGNFKTAEEAWNYSAVYQDKEGGEVFVESLNKGRVYNESLEENEVEQ